MSEMHNAVVFATQLLSALLAAFKKVNVEKRVELQANYLKKGYTWCNKAVWMLAKELGIYIPDGVLINDLAAFWFPNHEAKRNGWARVDDLVTAVIYAQSGRLVLAIWRNPGGHGHVAVIRPESTAANVRTWQAGLANFEDGPLERSFPKATMRQQLVFYVNIPTNKGEVKS